MPEAVTRPTPPLARSTSQAISRSVTFLSSEQKPVPVAANFVLFFISMVPIIAGSKSFRYRTCTTSLRILPKDYHSLQPSRPCLGLYALQCIPCELAESSWANSRLGRPGFSPLGYRSCLPALHVICSYPIAASMLIRRVAHWNYPIGIEVLDNGQVALGLPAVEKSKTIFPR